ncbi:MAG: hypothetical protein MMC33_006354, partial [Icmadophila ericetorum]|nr:hypothetical protein [Icmadophila ericetorum]
ACRDLYLMHVRVQGEIVYLNRHKRNRNVQMQLKETASSGNKSEGADIREKSPEEENAIGMEDGMEGTNNGQELYQQEVRLSSYRQRFLQLFTVPRIRRAAQAGFAVMIAQQLCGINILAFLSSTIFADASESSPVTTSQSLRDIYNLKALWMSFGFGLSNFVFTWLAWGNIDKKGRRFLLNWSFPCMCITLLGAALSFLISHDRESLRLGFIVLFVILFTIAYSAGEGPVAFTLSSEVFPLLNREVGMSFSVFWNLLGAGIVALTVPQLAYALKPTGLLGLFAGLNLVAWALVFFLVPETAQENLENMNDIFEVSTIEHFRYRIVCLKWSFNYYIRKRDPDRSDEPDPLAVWAKERERRWGDETRRAWSAGVSS